MEPLFATPDWEVWLQIERCLSASPGERKEKLSAFLTAATAEFVRLAGLGPSRTQLQEAQFHVLLKAIKEASQSLWVFSLYG